MEDRRAMHYPEHDRTSCSDAEPINAEAGGSLGCARCTAILLDQRDELLAALRVLTAAVPNCVESYRTVNARRTVGAALDTARAVIERAIGKAS